MRVTVMTGGSDLAFIGVITRNNYRSADPKVHTGICDCTTLVVELTVVFVVAHGVHDGVCVCSCVCVEYGRNRMKMRVAWVRPRRTGTLARSLWRGLCVRDILSAFLSPVVRRPGRDV